MNLTKIDWADYTWNPVVGCTKGCDYCYARHQAKRFRHQCGLCYHFTPHLHMSRLNDPELRRKKPLRIFLGSMGELFDPKLMTVVLVNGEVEFMPKVVIVQFVLEHLARFPQHTFIILTKRPELAKQYYFPPNVWLLTSIENQAAADERIPQLLECKASVLGISYEPAHGPVLFAGVDDKGPLAWCGAIRGIDWLIIGAESGNRKRKVQPECWWIERALEQARMGSVPVFVKDNVVKLYPEFEGIREFPH